MSELSELRERLGVSQRELAEAVGIPQATLSRMERGERDATADEEATIRAALAPREPVLEVAAVEHHASPAQRRMFVCLKCRRRVPLGPVTAEAPAAMVPLCQEHGPMVRQANRPYMGQSTEPGTAEGWPPARDSPVRAAS